MFIVALFTRAKGGKQSKHPLTGEWIKKLHTYTQWNIIQPEKKKENLPFMITWMDLEGIMPNEISKAEKNKYYIII